MKTSVSGSPHNKKNSHQFLEVFCGRGHLTDVFKRNEVYVVKCVDLVDGSRKVYNTIQ